MSDQEIINELIGQTQEILRLKALNAELAEALESIVKSLSDQDDEGMIEHAAPMLKARAALAKHKEE